MENLINPQNWKRLGAGSWPDEKKFIFGSQLFEKLRGGKLSKKQTLKKGKNSTANQA